MKYMIVLMKNGEHLFISDFPFYLNKDDRFQKKGREYEAGEMQVRTYVREL